MQAHLLAAATRGQPVDEVEACAAPTPAVPARSLDEHLQLGAVAVGEGLLDALGALQQRDGGLGLLLRVVAPPGEPAQPRQAAPGVAHPHALTGGVPDVEGRARSRSIASSMRTVR